MEKCQLHVTGSLENWKLAVVCFVLIHPATPQKMAKSLLFIYYMQEFLAVGGFGATATFLPSLGVDLSALHAAANLKYVSIRQSCEHCLPVSRVREIALCMYVVQLNML